MDLSQRLGRSKIAERTPKERRRIGAELRQDVPRIVHAGWSPPPDRADPVDILLAQERSRIPELLPIRHGRMQKDPFAFFRGAAAIMAADLAQTPSTGLQVQSCGDAHLANFGSYATPEGIPVFDLNDFDETMPAPFEWDVKRLATSVVVSASASGLSVDHGKRHARSAVCAYRGYLARLAELPPVVAWVQRIDLADAVAELGDRKARRLAERRIEKVLRSGRKHFGLVEGRGADMRIREKSPLVRRLDDCALPAREAFSSYTASLDRDRRVLLERHVIRDVAFKTVGVGSVGTFCAIILLSSGDGTPLLLQLKEAQGSVLAPFVRTPAPESHGERVVIGQRMMQAAPDIFLGWMRRPVGGRHFYVRRLKDHRLADVDARLEATLPFYAPLCGCALARAHGRAGDAALMSGYLGRQHAFDEAVADFAAAYAEQNERDWRAFRRAISEGRLAAEDAVPQPDPRLQGFLSHSYSTRP